jgi:hypothetical protein
MLTSQHLIKHPFLGPSALAVLREDPEPDSRRLLSCYYIQPRLAIGTLAGTLLSARARCAQHFRCYLSDSFRCYKIDTGAHTTAGARCRPTISIARMTRGCPSKVHDLSCIVVPGGPVDVSPKMTAPGLRRAQRFRGSVPHACGKRLGKQETECYEVSSMCPALP